MTGHALGPRSRCGARHRCHGGELGFLDPGGRGRFTLVNQLVGTGGRVLELCQALGVECRQRAALFGRGRAIDGALKGAHRIRRRAVGIVADNFDLASVDAAFRIDLLDADLRRSERGAVKRRVRGRPRLRPRRIVADKGYTSGEARWMLRRRGIRPVIPTKCSERRQPAFDRDLYRERN